MASDDPKFACVLSMLSVKAISCASRCIGSSEFSGTGLASLSYSTEQVNMQCKT